MVQSILWILFSVAIGYGLILFLMYVMQSKLVYHPQDEMLATPSEVGLEYQDVHLQTKDDVRLHGWFVPADSAQTTVLYLHGNAGNVWKRFSCCTGWD